MFIIDVVVADGQIVTAERLYSYISTTSICRSCLTRNTQYLRW